MDEATGQITYRRAVSKRLVFYDLKCCPDGISSDWIELVVKEGVFGSFQDVKDLRDSVKLGDTVAVRGQFEGPRSLRVEQMTVTQAWHTQGQPFVPQPAPLHQHTQQQPGVKPPLQLQQQQQQQQQVQPLVEQQQTAAVDEDRPAPGAQVQPPAPCARVQPPQLAVCKFFINTGRCAKGAACPHSHLSGPVAVTRSSWLSQHKARRQVLASSQGFSHGGASHCRRAAVFAAWLLETFGRELLNGGAGVLDIAGGAGGMTFELTAVHGIKCTLIDPRPLKLSKAQLRLLQQTGRPALLKTTSAEQLLLEQQPQPQTQLLVARPQEDGGQEEQPQQDQQQPQPQQHSQQQQQQELEVHQIQGFFGPELWNSPGWVSGGLNSCSLVLGLHPDQATEPAVDYALQAHKPFAVVPCCVFPRLFPHRRLPAQSEEEDGSSQQGVVTHHQLLQYLEHKGAARRAQLAFEGANTVLFRPLPPPAPREQEQE